MSVYVYPKWPGIGPSFPTTLKNKRYNWWMDAPGCCLFFNFYKGLFLYDSIHWRVMEKAKLHLIKESCFVFWSHGHQPDPQVTCLGPFHSLSGLESHEKKEACRNALIDVWLDYKYQKTRLFCSDHTWESTSKLGLVKWASHKSSQWDHFGLICCLVVLN